MKADPNDAVAAFTEYAADRLWVASHLTQLAGIALMVAALLVLAQQVEAARGKAWASLATGGAIASLAVAGMLQAGCSQWERSCGGEAAASRLSGDR